MIKSGHKTSLLIPSQLPEFIRDNPDYEKFVAFLQAYYEWMELDGNTTDRAKNILNYTDIDRTTEEFIKYYINDFLPYFPSDALVDKRLAIKIAKQLYESKGTPASYKFLFRVLYDSDFDFTYRRDFVLRASAGVWYVPKSLRLSTTDLNFLKINNYRLLGESSGSIATIENTLVVGNKIEVFISNIERTFDSGEIVRVVDNNNNPISDFNYILRAKIVGQIGQIKIDPNNRGAYYLSGDPIVVHGGISAGVVGPVEAIAQVGDVTKGSIQRIFVKAKGYGFRENPNTLIRIIGATDAIAHVGSVDPTPNGVATVVVAKDTIQLKRNVRIGNTNYNFANIAISNANTSLANALSFVNFYAYPIDTIVVDNGGGGVIQKPIVIPDSIYDTDYPKSVSDEELGIAHLKSLGILAPIQVANTGVGYRVNDIITFSGGSGYGAFANVASVYANGGINTVSYVTTYTSRVNRYPLGGLGYRTDTLPTLNVVSANANAHGAIISVPGILGDGAILDPLTDRAGAVTSVSILNYGEDYSSKPSVSLRVQDVLVSNLSIIIPPVKNDIVYQGSSFESASFIAYVDSFKLVVPDAISKNSLYNLRVYDYNSRLNTNLPLNIANKTISLKLANTSIPGGIYDENGIKLYGDGKAKATTTFLNGLTLGDGEYISTQSILGASDVLQSKDYNNFTYEITVQKEIEKYREILLNLLHPSGLKVLGRYAIKANSNYYFHSVDAARVGYPLSYHTGYVGSSIVINTNFINQTNNIIKFNNLAGANIATFIFPANSSSQNSSIIEIQTPHGPNVSAQVVSVDYVANTVSLRDNVWLTFANVATAVSTLGSNTINIVSLTGEYDLFNNGRYSNTKYPMMDIVYAGDTIKLGGNTRTVSSVDYINNIITLSSNFPETENTYLSVNRTYTADASQVRIFGPLGTQYIPELATEDGRSLTTENDIIIVLG